MKKSFLRFEVCDNHNINEYNESIIMEKQLFPHDDDIQELLSISDFYYLCKQFAAAMGYSESIVEHWFGHADC